MRAAIAGCLFAFLLTPAAALAAAPAPAVAIVLQDQTALRAAPRAGAPQHAQLWQGEALEVRGERLDYLQVYDYRRERGGFVRASQLRRVVLAPEQAPELLAVVRFLEGSAGAESLGIAFAAAYIQAAPAAVLNSDEGIEALDALGTMADRLAQRASTEAAKGKTAQAASAHLEVAARHGVRFTSNERDGRVYVCYDGDAFKRVLAMRSNAAQRARAVLGLTRRECTPGDLQPTERRRVDEWRAEVLDRVETDRLSGYVKNRVLMRRAAVWSSLAYQRARAGEAAETAAARAIADLSSVNRTELADDDTRAYSEAAMRVNASRWALSAASPAAPGRRPSITTIPGAPGETCILLVDAKNGPAQPLAKRCTYGIVWPASATLNREGSALAVAVQPTDAWREMWIFHKTGATWSVRVLPPAAVQPNVGYSEFAGWIPGGKQILVAREAIGEGRYRRNFELLRLDTLTPVRQSGDPSMLAEFQRWQDAAWKRETLAMR
jgi:hypothetical protein